MASKIKRYIIKWEELRSIGYASVVKATSKKIAEEKILLELEKSKVPEECKQYDIPATSNYVKIIGKNNFKTLIIPGIDPVELDKQRLNLSRVTSMDNLSQEENDALNGILNMLNHWSDNNQDMIKSYKNS